MNVNVSPEQERAKLTNLETAAAEANAPIQASCEPDSDRDQMCSTPSLKLPPSFKHSFVKLSVSDLVTGSLMRTYFNIDKMGAEVTQSLNERPHEPPTAQPNVMPPKDDADVELSERDQFEYPAPVSDDSESTVDTAQPANRSEDNASSGSSVVADTPDLILSSKYVLKIPKLKQMIQDGKDIKLKSKEMKLRGKHNPTLNSKLISSPSQYIELHTDIDVPQKYNRILDTAKFKISIALIDHSACHTPLPLPQPQSQPFTLVQEKKPMVFRLFSHSFALNSRRPSVDLVIQVEVLYYIRPEGTVPGYKEKNYSDSVDIQKEAEPLSGMNIVAEKTVPVTNEEKTYEWKAQGLKLHVPKCSLPAGCSHTHVTIFVAQLDLAQDTQHFRRIIHGVKYIDGEQPKPLTLTAYHSAANTPP